MQSVLKFCNTQGAIMTYAVNWEIKSNTETLVELIETGCDENSYISYDKEKFTVEITIVSEGYASDTKINVVELLQKLGLESGLTKELMNNNNKYLKKVQQDEELALRKAALSKLSDKEKKSLGLSTE